MARNLAFRPGEYHRRPSADPEANTRDWSQPPVRFDEVLSELERPAPGDAPLPPEPSAFGPPMGEADDEETP